MYIKTMQQADVYKHDAASTANTAQLMHGPGGLFNTPGLENAFLSTVIKPKGIGPLLPAFPTNYTDPRYGYITEIADDADAEPVEICDDAPTATLKSGTLSSEFGRVQTATDTIELATASMILNRADHTDLLLAGQLLSADGVEQPRNVTESGLMNNLIQTEMVKAAFLMGLKMNKLTWQGNPADATAGEGYKPFRGIDLLVKTGHVDSATDNAVAALDSVVVDGAWGTLGPGGDYAFVQELRYVLAYLNDLADNTVGGAEFAIVMRPEVWEAVSDAWAAAYADEMTAQIDAATASRWMLDAASLTNARDQMKASQMLSIGGRTVPVILDSGILQLDNADDGVNIPLGSYSSSIFVLPLRIGAGNMPVLYWEYLNWGIAQNMLSAAGISEEVFWTDGARFIWTIDRKKTCIKLQTRVEPRIILRTPQLAARFDDLLVTPVRDFRSPHASDAGYVGGGETTRTAPVKHLD